MRFGLVAVDPLRRQPPSAWDISGNRRLHAFRHDKETPLRLKIKKIPLFLGCEGGFRCDDIPKGVKTRLIES
jgi:hypothetical protein